MKFKYVSNKINPFLTKGKDYDSSPNTTWDKLKVVCDDGETRFFDIKLFQVCVVEPHPMQL